MKKCISFILIIMLLSFCGCQKTPETPIVVGKDQQVMLEKAETNENRLEKEEIVPRFQKEIIKDKLTVRVDTEVEVSETTMPILQVESVDFTQEQVDVMWNVLVKDTPMFQVAQMTKSDIEEMILTLEQRLSQEKDSEKIEILNNGIDRYRAMYESAPETYDPIPASPKFQVDILANHDGKEISSEYLYVRAYEDPANLSGKRFSVHNNYIKKETEESDQPKTDGLPQYRNATIRYETSMDDYQYFESEIVNDEVIVLPPEDVIPDVAYNLNITPKEAWDLAEQFAEETKAAGEFRVSVLKLVKNEIGQYAYLIEFQRIVDGVPCANVTGESVEYAKHWSYEGYRLLIDNDGIRSFEWCAPLTVTGTEVEEAALMSFDESMAIFEKMMPVIYEAESKEDWLNSVSFDISDVRLEYVRVLKQDANDEGLLIPVWSFYGTKTLHTVYDNNAKIMQSYDCWLMVNAIDGSIIDTAKGY